MSQQESLKKKLNDDLKEAMKSGMTVKRDTLRMLLATVKNTEIEKRGEIDNSDIITLVAKEIKKRNESIEAFKQGNREDLIAREQAEIDVLQGYMPQQMTQEEVSGIVRKIIGDVGASGPSDKGRVMKALMPEVKGKADGKMVSDIVDAELNK
jgi:uncharacterized protein